MAVLVFSGGVGTSAVYVSQRPTLAKGKVLGAGLLESNHAALRAITCDDEVEVGVDGARFWCRAEFRTGAIERLEFRMERSGAIKQTGRTEEGETRHHVDSSDPWAD